MKRHPSAVTADQRLMARARTLGRRHHAGNNGDDARDEPAPFGPDLRRCRVVRWLSATQHEVISETTVDQGLALAAAISLRCVVVDERGKTIYDNRRPFA